MPTSGTTAEERERERYVLAFNNTMIRIWREQITLLGVIDTGALYRSTVATEMRADGRYTEVTLSQAFRTYGLFQDYGTGSNTPRGNSGDLGHANRRERRRWFSRKYYASVMNLREFYADNLGRQYCQILSEALSDRRMRSVVVQS
jgi:hypothetical protein